MVVSVEVRKKMFTLGCIHYLTERGQCGDWSVVGLVTLTTTSLEDGRDDSIFPVGNLQVRMDKLKEYLID